MDLKNGPFCKSCFGPLGRMEIHSYLWASHVSPVVKTLPAIVGNPGDAGSIPGLGTSPGGGHGYPLQYSCPENPMDRGAWQATVHGASKESDTTEVCHGMAQHSYQKPNKCL